MNSVAITNGALACCHGFAVNAEDGPVGLVATPVFSGTSLEPVSLYVRTVDAVPGAFTEIPVEWVAEIDAEHRLIGIAARRDRLVPGGSTGELTRSNPETAGGVDRPRRRHGG
jgi:hypothetical protein